MLSRIFKTFYDIKVQKQIFDYETKVKNGLISIEENKVLIKHILNSDSIYKRDLLKLIDRSMAESIIIYLIEKYPNNFYKFDLNLDIYADLEKYYKKEPEKLNKIKRDYKDKINSFLSNGVNVDANNNLDNKKKKIIFEKEITN